MALFDDDADGFWAARFGMSPDDWRQPIWRPPHSSQLV